MSEVVDRLWEEYFIPGTDVLKNKLGIYNKEQLQKEEIDTSFEKICELIKNPINGNFDVEHLCLIHEYIFSDIYPFAGQFRTVNMRKKTFFTSSDKIKEDLEIVFREMWEDYNNVRDDAWAPFLAHMFSAIMKVHPFREGNGRTIREFVREFVEVYIPEYELKWSLMDKKQLDKGIEYANYLIETYLVLEFQKGLVRKEKTLKQ